MIVPPPVTVPKVTATPALGLPKLSVTLTVGTMSVSVPAATTRLSPLTFENTAAGPVAPVAVNVTLGTPAADARNVLLPGSVPSVHDPTAARPVALVTAVPPVTAPPPDSTVNVTVTPAIGLDNASINRTCGAVATAAFTVATCASPAVLISALGAAAAPVAVNTTGVSAPDVAVTVLGPATAPSVHDVSLAMPAAFVVAGEPTIAPPPVSAPNVTVAPLTPLPNVSVTVTVGAVSVTVATTAVRASPPALASTAAGPGVAVTVNVTGVSAPTVAVMLFGPAIVPSVHEPREA